MKTTKEYTYPARRFVPEQRALEYAKARNLAISLDDLARELRECQHDYTAVKGWTIEDERSIESGFAEVKGKLGSLIMAIREAAERVR